MFLRMPKNILFFNVRWRVGKWSECRACKYKSGVRTRQVECVREAQIPGDEDVLVEDKECDGLRPGTQQLCNSHKTCHGKMKRFKGELPEDVMKRLWYQTLEDPEVYLYVNMFSYSFSFIY